MNQATVAALLLVIVLALIVIIFTCLYYLWDKTKKLETLARNVSVQNAPASGLGKICGYSGRELYEVLRDKKDTPELIEEIKKSYVFYLGRHLEAAIEQGMIDRQKSRPSELESEIAVGGTRGEILSWLPMETLSKFYLLGRGINEQLEVDEDSEELQLKLNELVSEVLTVLGMGAYVNRMSDLITRKYLHSMSIGDNN